MAKAWRNETAREINDIRAWELCYTGKPTTPTARQQKLQAQVYKTLRLPYHNDLLDRLFERAGIIVFNEPVKGLGQKVSSPVEQKSVWQTTKSWLKAAAKALRIA